LPTYATSYTPEANANAEASQEQSQTSTSGSSSVSIQEHNPASSAAALYLGSCSNGMSAQARSGGIGLSNPDKYCQMLQQAEAHWKGYKLCKAGPERDNHHNQYHYWLAQASDYIDNTKGIAELAETSKNMATVGLSWGVIAYLLILL